MVDLMMTMMITDHWSLIRAHGLIEGDLYIGALFSIHDQVKLNDEDDENVKTTIWKNMMLKQHLFEMMMLKHHLFKKG